MIKEPIAIKCADGKIRHLRYTLGAIYRLEGMYSDGTEDSPSFFDILEKVKTRDLHVLRDVVWAGLLHEKEGLTPEDVGEFFSLSDVDYLLKQITAAVAQDVPLDKGIAMGFISERKSSRDIDK